MNITKQLDRVTTEPAYTLGAVTVTMTLQELAVLHAIVGCTPVGVLRTNLTPLGSNVLIGLQRAIAHHVVERGDYWVNTDCVPEKHLDVIDHKGDIV